MRNLLRPPSGPLPRDLETAMRAIVAATPLFRVHERELPYAVRDLSRLLTQERSLLRESYWINKRLLTAYCRYFLPWNLCRLSWLLPGLDIPLRAGDTILDLGSGPLTVPLALWLAKPEWRELPLNVVCGDVAPAPLNAGREIFRALAGDSPWTIELRRGPLEKNLREFSGTAALITAANVLNEIRPPRQTPLQGHLARILRRMAACLAPEGRLLAVEPGTRLGGKLISLARQTAFESRLVPEAPCPHWGPCPMLAEHANSWCHFSHTTEAAPPGLLALARQAGFDKQSLSLSCLLLRRASEDETRQAGAHLHLLEGDGDLDTCLDDEYVAGPDEYFPDGTESAESPWAEAFAALGPDQALVRIISDPIRLPDIAEPARYGCSSRGLVLVHDALRMPSGAAFSTKWPETETRDAKTGALELIPVSHEKPSGKGTQAGNRFGAPSKSHPGRDKRERNPYKNQPGGHGAPPEAGPGKPEDRRKGSSPARKRGESRQDRGKERPRQKRPKLSTMKKSEKDGRDEQ